MLLPLLALLATAQSAPMPAHKPAPSASAPVTQITLGQAMVALNGPWKFHIGDNPQWADPEFDDSGWQDYTVDPRHSALPIAQAVQSEQLPGWQQHGAPGYTGYAWYRIHLQTPPGAHALALLMPQYVDDAYEVFVNRQKIGSFGKLDRWHVLYSAQPGLLSIPAAALNNGQPFTLAIRVWNLRYEALPSEHNMHGGLRGVPLLGPAELLHALQQGQRDRTWNTWSQGWLFLSPYGVVGVISLLLFFFCRSQREYLWAGISLTGFAVMLVAQYHAPLMNIPSQLALIIELVGGCPAIFAMPLAGMYLLGVPRPLWRRAAYVVLAMLVSGDALLLGLHLGVLPPTATMDRVTGLLYLPYLALALLLLAIAVDGLRTIGRKAWLPLAPGLICACWVITGELDLSATGPLLVLDDVLFLSVPLAILAVFLMRFTVQQRENVRLVDDMKQAQEVQRIVIPKELPHIPGLAIESEYRPAREVGGDFFQVLPDSADGSVLIVVGDVTGKGLQAGMLVALIVGAIRAEAAHNSDPLTALNALNQRLCGRGHAYATCLALRIAADGAVTLANAGHLPPYLNGKELPMEGALPLGMIEKSEFPLMHFQLSDGDTLMLMSDGVAEAKDKRGQLFGFDRINEMLQRPITAAEVATAAQNYGQEDDISVLSVTRSPAGQMQGARLVSIAAV